MGLELKIASLEDVPEEIRDAYVKAKDGDGYELNFDAIKTHPGVAKLRTSMNEVDKKREAAEKAIADFEEKYGDLDPKAAREALRALEDADDKTMLDEGKVEELVEKKTGQMKAEYEKQIEAKDNRIKELEGVSENLNGELSSIKIYDAINDSALAKGARKEALTDIKNRANGTWSLRDGKPVALEGEDVRYGKDGEPLTIDEWVEGLASESPYLFEPNSGGGASGSGGGAGGGGSAAGKVISPDSAGDNITAIANGEMSIDH